MLKRFLIYVVCSLAFGFSAKAFGMDQCRSCGLACQQPSQQVTSLIVREQSQPRVSPATGPALLAPQSCGSCQQQSGHHGRQHRVHFGRGRRCR